LPEIDWKYIESTGFINHKINKNKSEIDKNKSEIDLFSRCEACEKQRLKEI